MAVRGAPSRELCLSQRTSAVLISTIMPLRILIVEDDAALAFTYRAILSQRGHTVTVASTCALATDAANTNDFDVAICDLALDDGNSGLDVIAAVRRRNPDTAVVLLTGHEDDELERTAAQEGIVLLYKPLDVPILIERVESLLPSRRTAAGAA
jgi:DNA-binding response OmpR family regulator